MAGAMPFHYLIFFVPLWWLAPFALFTPRIKSDANLML